MYVYLVLQSTLDERRSSSWTSKKRKAAVQFSRKFDGVPRSSPSSPTPFLAVEIGGEQRPSLALFSRQATMRIWRPLEAETLSASHFEDLLLRSPSFTYKIQCNSIFMFQLGRIELPIKRLIRAKLVNQSAQQTSAHFSQCLKITKKSHFTTLRAKRATFTNVIKMPKILNLASF